MNDSRISEAGVSPGPVSPYRRYRILLSALLMQMCLGATYAWAVFVQPLRQLTGLSQGLIQLPFTVFYFAFPATMIFAGTLLPRFGPRRCAVAGGILFGGGWLVASLGQQHFVLTVLGIGLLAGIGVGCAYIVPIAVCIQWFPKQKGLVTGLAVAGFGGGAALVGQAGGRMVDSGMSPFMLFSVFGLVFLLAVTAAGLSMDYAPGAASRRATALRAREIIGRSDFRVLYGAMVTGLAAGFAVNANLKELSPGGVLQAGVTAVSLFALANAAGRIVWGALFDRMRAADAIRANLVAQAAVLVAGIWFVQAPAAYFVFASLVGFNYGGVLVLYASTAARRWGSDRVGQVYGLLFSANIVAAPAPVLAGLSYDASGAFHASLFVIALLMAAAAAWVTFRSTLLNAEETGRAASPLTHKPLSDAVSPHS